MSEPQATPHRITTVGDLRDALATFPADMPVSLEGCDCYGTLAGISLVTFSSGVCLLLRREDSTDEAPWLYGAPASASPGNGG